MLNTRLISHEGTKTPSFLLLAPSRLCVSPIAVVQYHPDHYRITRIFTNLVDHYKISEIRDFIRKGKQIMTKNVPHCVDCPLRKTAEAKPKSLLGRLWFWHITWCPGWKAYQAYLAQQKP
jgi:hypothetical protein